MQNNVFPTVFICGIVRIITILRSGIICFLILQTVFPNWERRLAVRAPDERRYELFCVCTQNKWRSLTAATDDTQFSYKQKRSGNNVLHFANLLPDHNFPFSIFNFTFNETLCSLFHTAHNSLYPPLAAVARLPLLLQQHIRNCVAQQTA